MRVLVSWGSKRGGTEGLAREIGAELQRQGLEVVMAPAAEAPEARGFDAAVIGSALYANLWRPDARRLVERNLAAWKQIPVWLFSSGPLDDSADRSEIAPVPQAAVLAERIGALGHATFGGRLAKDAKGFPAASMARTRAGDWRNLDRVRAWARQIAAELPQARPGIAHEPPAGSLRRLAAYGAVGGALCAMLLAGLTTAVPHGVALALHAAAAPIVFGLLAVRYFGARGARGPASTALAFTALLALLDFGLVLGLLHRFDAVRSPIGIGLALALVFAVTWAVGQVMSMLPEPAARRATAGPMASSQPAPN